MVSSLREELAGKGHEETFREDRKVLYFRKCVGHRVLSVTSNYIKLLWSVLFIVCKLYFNKKGENPMISQYD